MKQHAKTTSVVLAILLQLAPMARQVVTQIAGFAPNIAVIFRWGIGVSALLGTVDAVSGASTVITSPLTATGTNGVPFTYRITTGPQVATSFSAAPLPPGLTLNASTGRITGTPTQVGVTLVTLKGCDGGNGCTPSATLTLTIVAGAGGGGTVPSITTQPASQTVTAGSSATFSVVAAGTAPLSYKWRFNGANISGATAASYSIANAQAANAGTYSVVISNSAGSVTSANATLMVNPAPIAPSIMTQPVSQAVNTGANISFSVVAAGTAPLSYQWRFNNANIAGATSNTYNLNTVQSANAGNYSVLVSNVAGSVLSAAATLTVSSAPVAPSIVTQPASQTVTAVNNVTFNVTATGTAPLFYQWRFNGAEVAGATSSSYTLNNAQAANVGTYSVVVSNSAGSVTSANATLTVNPASIAPSITTQPASQAVNTGANVSFSVVAAGTAPLSYQWRFNNANIAGATSNTYTLNNVQAANAGNYSVSVSNVAGSVVSATAALAVSAAPVAPSITTQPASQTVSAGNNANFSVTATGTGPLFYQWRFNGADVAGATSSSYTLNNAQAANAGAYSVLVSNAVGSVTSGGATLTVTPAPVAPSLTTQPVSQTVATGASASFNVTATGTAPLTYQWRFNGGNIAGATGSSYTLNNAKAANAGNYSVVVGNAAGNVTSAAAALTVLPPPPVAPSIATPPASQTAVLGGSATFTVTVTGTSPLSYRWRFNGSDIVGATSATFAIANVQNTDAGNYDVVVNNSVGSATSASATLSVVVSKPSAGTYQGLFYDTNRVALTSSGYLSLALDENYHFNAMLMSGTAQITFDGTFDGAGHAVVTPTGSQSLIVELQLDLANGGDQLTGRVTEGSWDALLSADRRVSATNGSAAFAGNYPLVIHGLRGGGDGDNDRVRSPDESDHGGSSSVRGTARVNRKGTLIFRGKLGQGVTVRQKSAVSKNGDWPFYIVLPRGQGVVIGWIQVSQQPSRSVSGDLIWFQPDGTATKVTVTPP